MHRYKTVWYSIRPTHDFQAVKFGGSKGVPRGERSELGRKRGAGRWRTVVEKRASGAERAGNIDHTAITANHSKARRTRQVVDTGL